MMKPLLSIILPTKNRNEFLLSAVKSVLSIIDDELEVIVQDNGDSDILEKKLSDLTEDTRLKYYYDNREMPISHNFDAGLSKSRGEYVCIIGDDDGVNLNIMKYVKWAKSNEIDSLISTSKASYKWPKDENSGCLIVYPFEGSTKIFDVAEQLKAFIRDGGVYYLKYKLPRVYHGIIRKQCLDEIKEKCGGYFMSLTPDSFSSLALATVVRKTMEIDYPITLPGSSKASDQTHRTGEAKTRKLEDAPHFFGRESYDWPDLVPKLYSGETIWAESNVKALQTMGREDLLSGLNPYKLAAIVAIASPHYINELVDEYLLKKCKGVNRKKVAARLKNQIRRVKTDEFLHKSLNVIKKLVKGQKTKHYKGIQDLELGAIRLSDHIEKNNLEVDLPY